MEAEQLSPRQREQARWLVDNLGLLSHSSRSRGAAFRLAILWAVFGVLGMFVTRIVDPLAGFPFDVSCLVGFIWVGGFIGILVAGTLVTRHMVASRLGDPIMDISVAEVHPGDAFDLTYLQPVTGEVAVKEVMFRFIRREMVIERGPEPTTQVNDVKLEETVLPGGLMTPGQVIQRRVRFHVPSDAEPTAIAETHRLQYFAEVKIDVPDWPDANEIYEIPVTLLDSN